MSVIIDTSMREVDALIKYARYGANNCMMGNGWEIKELVRCNECKHLGDNDGYYFCNAIGIAFGDKPDWFCADGERKEKMDEIHSNI